MSDRDYYGYDRRDENGFSRFLRWLGRRPTESWMFFAAGVFIASILF